LVFDICQCADQLGTLIDTDRRWESHFVANSFQYLHGVDATEGEAWLQRTREALVRPVASWSWMKSMAQVSFDRVAGLRSSRSVALSRWGVCALICYRATECGLSYPDEQGLQLGFLFRQTPFEVLPVIVGQLGFEQALIPVNIIPMGAETGNHLVHYRQSRYFK
jgi:hypothetical protein